MVLCWATYNKRPVLVLIVGSRYGKIIGLKVRDQNGPELISEKSINRIRSLAGTISSLDFDTRISELRRIVSEFKNVYRTYDIDKFKLIQQFKIGPL